MKRKHNIPIAAILLAICSTPTLADVTGSYAENTPTEISYLQLVQADSSISGSIKVIDAVTTSPGYKISNINIAGSAHGATLYIWIDAGLLGSSGLFTCEAIGDNVTVNFPSNNGLVSATRFHKVSPERWNNLVVSFETRTGDQYELQVAKDDYATAAAAFDADRADAPHVMVDIKSAVADVYARSAKAAAGAALVDKANAADVSNTATIAQLEADQQRLADDENKHGSGTLSDQTAYNADTRAYQDDAATIQADMANGQVTSANLGSAENTAPDSLWQIVDGEWADITKINSDLQQFIHDEADVLVQYDRAAADRNKILQICAQLKLSSPFGNNPIITRAALVAELKASEDIIAALMPKPLPALASSTGQVSVDSAAVRNYCPDDGHHSHDSVEVLQTVTKGQAVTITGQTLYDYVVKAPNGAQGLILKSDIQLVGGGGAVH